MSTKNLDRLFEPRSIAVIGAIQQEGDALATSCSAT